MINGFDDIDYLQNIKENCWYDKTLLETNNKKLS
jgi:hypothetical protein